jgi:hypothetical protein
MENQKADSEEWKEFTKIIEGDVLFKMPMPQTLSLESLEDLEYWLNGILKKIRRIVSDKQKDISLNKDSNDLPVK